MDVTNRYKLRLCNFHENNKECNKGSNCTFAHGKDELRCIFDEDCVNEECKRIHLKRDKNIITKNKEKLNNNKINIFDYKEFPVINNKVKDKNEKNKKEEYMNNYKYSGNLTSNLKKVLNITENNNNLEDNLIKVKEQLQKKYIELSQIDKNNWANSIDIEDIENEINILELKYEKLKTLTKKENNIFDDENLNLDIIFNIDDKKEINENDFSDDIKIPVIKLTINGVNYNEDNYITKSIKNKTNSVNNTDNKINILIDNIEKKISNFNENIKQIINDEIKNDYFKIILLNNLNKINSEINLLKNNYKDVIDHYKNTDF